MGGGGEQQPRREDHVSSQLGDLTGSCQVIDGITTAGKEECTGRGGMVFTMRVARGLCGTMALRVVTHLVDIIFDSGNVSGVRCSRSGAHYL